MNIAEHIVARIAEPQESAAPAALCGHLLAWFGGHWLSRWDERSRQHLIEGHGISAEAREKANAYVVGWLNAMRTFAPPPADPAKQKREGELFPARRLTADLHGVVGGNWTQGPDGKLTAAWAVVHFPEGGTLAEAPYIISDAPLDMHGAARMAAQRNRFDASEKELYLALPVVWDGNDWDLGRVAHVAQEASNA